MAVRAARGRTPRPAAPRLGPRPDRRLRHYDNDALAWTEYAFERVCPFARAERHFLAQIEKGEQGPHDRYVGYRVDHLLEQTQRSATEDRPVDLAWEA